MTQRCICLLTGLVLAAAAGCGHGSGPGPNFATPHPVHGTITFTGKTPLVGGLIWFKPTESSAAGKTRYEGSGLVDANGQYKLGLAGDGRGLPAGEYKVTVEPREFGEPPNSNSTEIPQKYRDKSATPFTVTVEEKDNTLDFVLQ